MRLPLRPILGALCVSVALLSGCSILPKNEPQARYNLPATTIQPIKNKKNTSLYINTPKANRLIASNRILVQPTGSEIQVYKGVQWTDNAPALLRDRFIKAMTDAQLFTAVSLDGATKTEFVLESYIRHFQVQYQNQQPVVIAEIDIQLLNRATNAIVRSQRFYSQKNAADTSVPAVIAAFGLVGDELSLQLIDWLAK